jgi:hypothetical protein
MTECEWHDGEKPIVEDDTPGCPNCQRLYHTKICDGCGYEFLDWDCSSHDDIIAGPAVSESGDMYCTGCIGQAQLDDDD